MFYGWDVYGQRRVYTQKAPMHVKKCTLCHNCHESVAGKGGQYLMLKVEKLAPDQ